MGPEEVFIEFALDAAQATAVLKDIEDRITSIDGAAVQLHDMWDDRIEKTTSLLEEQLDVLTKIHDLMGKDIPTAAAAAHEEIGSFAKVAQDGLNDVHDQTVATTQAIYENVGATQQLQSATNDMHDAARQAFVLIQRYAGMTMEAINDIITVTEYMRVSAGLTGYEFRGMLDSLTDAAVRTDMTFGDLAQKARTIFDFVGVTAQLGEIVEAGAHMNRVFALAGDEFERFAAFTIKWGKGATTATRLMQQFDNVLGLTGDKMDNLLSNLTDIGRELAKITGGGRMFARAMEQITRYAAETTSYMQQMGGEGEVVAEIMQQVSNPEQWDSLVERLPGLANNLVHMQKAMTAGDMDTFNRLLTEGAKRTRDMGAGMDNFVRAATGWDFQTADILAEMGENARKSTFAMEAQASVLERSRALLVSFSQSAQRFANIVMSVFMRVLEPAIRQIADALVFMNEKLADNRSRLTFIADAIGAVFNVLGWLIAGVIRLIGWLSDWIGTTNTLLVMLFVAAAGVKMLTGLVLGLASSLMGPVKNAAIEAGRAIGEGIGQGAARATQGLAQVGAIGPQIWPGIAAILSLGVALLMVAGAVWILSQSNPLVAAAAIVTLGLAIAGLALLAPYIAIGTTLINTFAAGMLVLSVAVLIASAALWIGVQALSTLAGLPYFALAGGIIALSGALIVFSVAMVAVALLSPAILLAAVAIGVFGVALLVFGSAVMITAVAANILAAAIMTVAYIPWHQIGDGLVYLGYQTVAFAGMMVHAALVATIPMIILGAAFVVFGAGLLVAAVPMMIFATAMLIFASAALIFASAMHILSGVAFWYIIGGMLGLAAASPILLLGMTLLAVAGAFALVAAIGFLPLAGALFLLAVSLDIFSRLPFALIAAQFFALGVTIALAALYMTAPALALAPALFILGAAMGVLGIGIALFNASNVFLAALGLVVLGAALLAFGIIMTKTLPFLPAIAIAAPVLAILGAALIVLSLGLMMLGNAPLFYLAAALPLLAISLSVFAVSALVFGTILGIMAPLLMVAGLGFMVLAMGLQSMANVDLLTLSLGMVAFSGALVVFALSMFAALPSLPIMFLVGISLAFFAAMLVPVIATLMMFNQAAAFAIQVIPVFGASLMILAQGLAALAQAPLFWSMISLGSLAAVLFASAVPFLIGAATLPAISRAIRTLAVGLDELADSNFEAGIDAIKAFSASISNVNIEVDMQLKGLQNFVTAIIRLSNFGKDFDPNMFANMAVAIHQLNAMPAISNRRVGNTLQVLMDTMIELEPAIEAIVDMAITMEGEAKTMRSALNELFGPDGMIIETVHAIHSGLKTGTGFFGGDKFLELSESVQETISAVIGFIGDIINIFDGFVEMAGKMRGDVSDITGNAAHEGMDISQLLKQAVDEIFGPEGIVLHMVRSLVDSFTNYGRIRNTTQNILSDKMIETVQGTLSIIDGFVSIFKDFALMALTLQNNQRRTAGGAGNILDAMEFAIESLFGKNGIIIQMSSKISENLSADGWVFSGNMISDEMRESIGGVYAIVQGFVDIFTEFATMAMVLNSQRGQEVILPAMRNAVEKLFGKDGLMIAMSKNISDGMKNINKSNVETAMAAMNMVGDTIHMTSNAFRQLSIMGILLQRQVSGFSDNAPTYSQLLRKAIDDLFAPETGIMTILATNIADGIGRIGLRRLENARDGMVAITDVMSNVTASFNELAIVGIMNETTKPNTNSAMGLLDDIAAIVNIVNDVNRHLTTENLDAFGANLDNYYERVANFIDNMSGLSADIDIIERLNAQISAIKGQVEADVHLVSEGGAEVALERYEETKTAHQQTVEQLLTDIRDGIRGMGGKGGEVAQAQRPAVAGFDAQSAFSGFGGGDGVF